MIISKTVRSLSDIDELLAEGSSLRGHKINDKTITTNGIWFSAKLNGEPPKILMLMGLI